MPRALVTGANGFIGSHLCELLLDRGYEVVGLVRPTSDIRSLVPLSRRFGPRFRLAVGDLRDPASLSAAVDGADYVFHLAATVMATSETEFRESIVTGTRHLLATVRERCPALRRFLMTSSQAAAGPSPSAEPIDETRPPAPVSWYGRAKADAEREVLGSKDVPATIVRPVSVYGERETDLSGGTFPAVKCGFAPRIGWRRKTLTLVYVGDLVRGMVAAAESPNTVGKIYFLADRAPVSASDLVRAIAHALDKTLRLPLLMPQALLGVGGVLAEWVHFFTRARPALTRDKVREVRQQHWAVTAAAAGRDFGWQANVDLPDGLRRATTDWLERSRRAADLTAQPDRERAVQTFLLAVLVGVLFEGTSFLAKWYEFNPGWFIIVAVLGYFGALCGTMAFLLARRSRLIQFLASAVLFLVVEMANYYQLHLWAFKGPPFGDLNPWVRAGLLAVPVGLVPVIINGVVGAIYRKRLRIG